MAASQCTGAGYLPNEQQGRPVEIQVGSHTGMGSKWIFTRRNRQAGEGTNATGCIRIMSDGPLGQNGSARFLKFVHSLMISAHQGTCSTGTSAQ
jgi:hypothetical protein